MQHVKRLALVAAMVVVTINLWTGAPVLSLWVGSRLVPASGLSMLAVGVVCVTLAVTCFVLIRILGALTQAHDQLIGKKPAPRRHSPWLRAMSGERPHAPVGQAPPLATLDYVLITGVAGCVIAFEVWFFFYAGSSLPLS